MKVSILIDSLKTGGAQKQSAILAKLLSTEYEVVFIVFDSTGIKESFLNILKSANVNIQFVDTNKLNVFFKVYQILKQEKVDILIAYLPFGNLVAGMLGKLLKIKLILGGIRNEYVFGYKDFIQKYIHNYLLDASVANSQVGMDSHFNAGYSQKPIYHIPNCFLLNQLPISRFPTNQIKILSVGRFVAQKNYELALECICACNNRLQNSSTGLSIKYQIIGYGELEQEIRNMVVAKGLTDIVEIIIDPPSINNYYTQADIYLCTSKFEGLSNSIMEAMSFSLPIIATNVGGNAELVQENINGFITEQTPLSITNKLLLLMEDYDKRLKFGEQSYYKIKNTYGQQAFFERYNQLISNKLKTKNINNPVFGINQY